jgi:hypothetical protein
MTLVSSQVCTAVMLVTKIAESLKLQKDGKVPNGTYFKQRFKKIDQIYVQSGKDPRSLDVCLSVLHKYYSRKTVLSDFLITKKQAFLSRCHRSLVAWSSSAYFSSSGDEVRPIYGLFRPHDCICLVASSTVVEVFDFL